MRVLYLDKTGQTKYTFDKPSKMDCVDVFQELKVTPEMLEHFNIFDFQWDGGGMTCPIGPGLNTLSINGEWLEVTFETDWCKKVDSIRLNDERVFIGVRVEHRPDGFGRYENVGKLLLAYRGAP